MKEKLCSEHNCNQPRAFRTLETGHCVSAYSYALDKIHQTFIYETEREELCYYHLKKREGLIS